VLHDELDFHPVYVHDLIGDEDLLDATGVQARAEFYFPKLLSMGRFGRKPKAFLTHHLVNDLERL
jgi:hypothetical protein